MKIPFIDLRRLENEFHSLWSDKVAEISKMTAFIGGAEVDHFEKSIAHYCQARHAISCANGTDAIQLALRTVGVEQNDLVILPDFTFWATFEAVINVGAQPITVDISAQDLQMDFAVFKDAVVKYRPKAAILVHLYGSCSRHLQEYRQFCQQENIILIEDGAQAFGSLLATNESIFHNAAISTLSFYPAKVLGGAGDGGAILTQNDDYAQKARQLANHGRSEHYSYDYVGWNSRLDALQAAYLNCSLIFFENRIQSRRQTNALYNDLFLQLELPYLRHPQGFTHNGYLNVVVIDKRRDELRVHLQENGIASAIIYPETISQQSGAQPYLSKKMGGQIARSIGKKVLSLPLFSYLRAEEFEKIKRVLTDFFD